MLGLDESKSSYLNSDFDRTRSDQSLLDIDKTTIYDKTNIQSTVDLIQGDVVSQNTYRQKYIPAAQQSDRSPVYKRYETSHNNDSQISSDEERDTLDIDLSDIRDSEINHVKHIKKDMRRS